ncbi:hypothetical protein NPIL_244921, partial [Nephila pilipes]
IFLREKKIYQDVFHCDSFLYCFSASLSSRTCLPPPTLPIRICCQ